MLTVVIGGNHEASNYLWELYHGGWLAPNIYFLGHAGCVQVNGIRISGASGIFKHHDFQHGHWEKMPYDHGSMRSIYHIREYNVRRLSLLSSPDVFLSHDWPQSIEHHGDTAGLLRRKPFFRQDINSGNLGSPPLMGLLRTLQPQWWFSAHLHVRFEASVVHGPQPDQASVPSTSRGDNPDEILIEDEDEVDEAVVPDAPTRNPDEIALDDEDVIVPPAPPPTPKTTHFLALDKCLPRRDFLEVVDILIPPGSNVRPDKSAESQPVLSFDPEWLAITRAFDPYFSTTRHQPPFPDEVQAREMVKTELKWVEENIVEKRVELCQQFVMTAPGPGSEGAAKFQQPPWYTNPQTVAFCTSLNLQNKINPAPASASSS